MENIAPITEVVFLDFDGVVFTQRSTFADYNNPEFIVDRDLAPDPIAVRFLNRLHRDNPTLATVLISSWRGSRRNPATNVLEKSGFTGRIHPDWQLPFCNGSDGEQIDKFLADHLEITNYVIITDDLDHLRPHQLPHTIPCHHGISHENMLQTSYILQSDDKHVEYDNRWQIFQETFPGEPVVAKMRRKKMKLCIFQKHIKRQRSLRRNNERPDANMVSYTRAKRKGLEPN